MLYLRHGGHVLSDSAPDARETARRNDVVLESGALRRPVEPADTPFDHLLPQLKDKPDAHLPGDPQQVVADLNALGALMVDDGPPVDADASTDVNATIPAIYTYWGQFVDHDLTANTDRDSALSDITRPDLRPVPPDEVTAGLRNLRRPTLDLDSVYGDGPAFSDPDSPDAGFYDGARFRLACHVADGIPGVRIPPDDDLARDLPRIGPLLDAGTITLDDLPDGLRDDPNLRTRAFIGDLRDDENLVVAQFHLGVLRFHNAVVNRIEAHPHRYGLLGRHHNPAVVFERARRLTRLHHQWLVVNDYLRTVTLPGVLDKVLLRGPRHYRPLATHEGRELHMPLEYSVAAFRFGHSMVRGPYDHNRNFGRRLPGQGDGDPVRRSRTTRTARCGCCCCATWRGATCCAGTC